MNKIPPTTSSSPTSDSMRIGPFWKRAGDSPAALAPNSDEPFDALTDLFLGEVTGSRLPGARPASRTEPARPAPSPRSTLQPPLAKPSTAQPTPAKPAPGDCPVLRLAGADEDDEYRLEPAPVSAPSHAQIQTRPAAPVLTLDDDTGEASPVMGVLPPPVRHPVLELLVLGNLPIVAGAWAGQYVREIAEAAGKPVAYLRVQGEFASLELIGALADVAAAPRSQDLTSIDAAIDAAAEVTDRWIIRCDSGHESPIIAASITRAVTVLTGADQAAREACKRTLAALVPQLPAADSGPMVRLAIMGAGPDSAGSAAPELAAIATAALSRPVPAIACAGKIGGVRPPHTLFSGPIEHTVASVLHSVERALIADPIGPHPFPAPIAAPSTPTPTIAASEPSNAPTPEPVEVVQATAPAAEPEVPAPAPKPEQVVEAPVPAAPVIITTIDTTTRVLPAPSIITAPAASIPEPVAPTPIPEPVAAAPAPVVRSASVPIEQMASSLASHLTDLTATALRCPYASGVEIAIDSTGALHLLARSSSDRSDDAAVASLLVASSWTETHAPLLAPALGTRPLPTRPTLHLFTDRPKATRRLLDTTVRVHLLAEVAVGQDRAWYCTDLN